MILHRALRRPAAALLFAPLIMAAACSPSDDGGPDSTADTTARAEAEAGAGNAGEAKAEPGATGGSGGGAGGGPSPSIDVDDDGNPITDDAPPAPVTIDADAIQFTLGGTQLLCWADADDGSEDSVFGCQGAAGWAATDGSSPASALLFTLDDDAGEDAGDGSGAELDVKAIQANAPVTAWEIQGVRAGGIYRLGDATIDLTDRDRLIFAVPVGDSSKTASGWVTVDDYGWDE